MKSMSQSGQLDMDMIFSIMTEEKGNQKETLENQHKQTEKYLRRTQRRSRWRKPSSDFWNVSCRENGAGTAANLLFREVNAGIWKQKKDRIWENEVSE